MKRQRLRFKLAALLLIGLLALSGIYGVHSVSEYGTRLIQEQAAETSAAEGGETPSEAAEAAGREEGDAPPSEAPPGNPDGSSSPAPEESPGEAETPSPDSTEWRRIYSPSSDSDQPDL